MKDQLVDDYAIARLFERGGGRLFQATVFVDVTMTIAGPRHYARVMRRWMIFANLYLGRNANPKTLILVALPAMLPLAGLVVALIHGWIGTLAWIALLAAKAVANHLFLRRTARRRTNIPAEMVSSICFRSSTCRR